MDHQIIPIYTLMVIVQVGFDRRVVKRTKSQASSGGGNVGRYWDITRVLRTNPLGIYSIIYVMRTISIALLCSIHRAVATERPHDASQKLGEEVRVG